MKKLLCLLLLLPCGCGKVLGYYPTEEELAAIQRGEDPRANESTEPRARPTEEPRDRSTSGGLESDSGRIPASPDAPRQPAEEAQAGPASASVLRWVDCSLVIVEAEGRRERLRLAGVSVPRDFVEAQEALEQARQDYPSGTRLSLSYPQKNSDGKSVVFRNAEGELLATIARAP